MFQKILVPIDFDETSDHAFDRAISLAEKLGASITVVHVYSLPVYNFPDGSYVPTAEVSASVRAGAKRQLDAYLEKRKSRAIPLTGTLREGRTVDEVCAVAKEIGADLIVMGTHGRGLLGRALLGSVALGVLRQSPIPVMTVRSSAEPQAQT
jgi:nucleotide-binding universal stress UspA family protein